MKHLILFFFLLFSFSSFAQNWAAERDYLLYQVLPSEFSDSLYKERGIYGSMLDVLPDGRTLYQTIRLRDFPYFRPGYGRRTETWESLSGFARKFMTDPDTLEYQVSDWIYVGNLFFYKGIHQPKLREAQRKCFRNAYKALAKNTSLEDYLSLIVAYRANGDSLYYVSLVSGLENNKTNKKIGILRLLRPEEVVRTIPHLVDDGKFNQLFSSLKSIIIEEIFELKKGNILTKDDLDETETIVSSLYKSSRLSEKQAQELVELKEIVDCQRELLSKEVTTASKD